MTRAFWSMRDRTRARMLSFGSRHDADFRFEAVRSPWPERLSFELSFGGRRRRVESRLIGEHLVGSAVAAIAIAHTLGLGVDDAIDRIADLPPTERRMSAVITASGIAVVRDDFKAVSDSLGEFLRFLEQARAERKVAVVGRISDHPGRSRSVYTEFAHQAAKIIDLLVFVGERPESLWGRTRRGSSEFLADFAGERSRGVRDSS